MLLSSAHEGKKLSYSSRAEKPIIGSCKVGMIDRETEIVYS